MTWKKRVVALTIVAVTIAGGLLLYSVAPGSGASAWQTLTWRVRLYARKATGSASDLSWSELWQMSRRRGGFGLASMVIEGRSADGAVSNPYVSEADRQAGAESFRQRCVVCHGSEGRGGSGPPLNRPGFKHGDSDLAVFRVVRDGVPNTSMVAASLSPDERWQVVGYLKSLQIGTGRTATASSALNVSVSGDRLRGAGSQPADWLTYSGSLNGWRFTRLNEITPENVSRLRIRWVRQFDIPDEPIESTPLVVDGVMFVTLPPSSVVALDVTSGKVLWKYDRSVPADLALCCRRINRGLAILDRVLYFATLDANLVAIDANTGQQKWQVPVASASDGFTMTGAPLIAGRSVIVGVGGGEYGIRGFLAAYDATSGSRRWKFDTIPGPGQPGHETWTTDAWQTGGGPTWITGSYDPELDLIFWGVGNPAPDFSGDARPGDNLFTNSVVALRAESGTLAWHFQFTPHDHRDWDSAQTPILADVMVGGTAHKAICWPNRNGFYYVLDRSTGQFLIGTPFVEQNWTTGLDAAGRPMLPSFRTAADRGRLTRPGLGGGTNWQNAAFDEARGLVFVHATEGSSVFTQAATARRADRGLFLGSFGSSAEPAHPVVRALDVATGVKKWENFSPPLLEGSLWYSGLLATAGGVVFGASAGSLFALDSTTGRELSRIFYGGDSRAAPISFSVDGHQVIAVSIGRSLFVLGL